MVALRLVPMGLGRRKASLDNPSAWVFNRMADVYGARPAYPAPLVDAMCELAGHRGRRIGDLGAGVGHLALPLAARGFDVVAVEPARAMLERLRHAALTEGLRVRGVHATAESLPLADASLDLVVIADALHFLDAALTAREIARVLAPGGVLALVTCALGDTPFMRGVVQAMEAAAPRRPRNVLTSVAHVSAVAQVPMAGEQHFSDETPVDDATLEQILRSISYIGPAMNPVRFAAFRERIQRLSGERVWSRTFTLRWGRRR